MTSGQLSFGLIVVGDEILNGRRQDRHFAGIGGLLRERGYRLAWLRILPDDPAYLSTEFARTMAEGLPVFCCGGIGATPDDRTRECAARAAGVPLRRHPEAAARIEAAFGEAEFIALFECTGSEDGTHRYRIEGREDLGEALFNLAATKGFALLEIQKETVSLEEIFTRLTQEGGGA